MKIKFVHVDPVNNPVVEYDYDLPVVPRIGEKVVDLREKGKTDTVVGVGYWPSVVGIVTVDAFDDGLVERGN